MIRSRRWLAAPALCVASFMLCACSPTTTTTTPRAAGTFSNDSLDRIRTTVQADIDAGTIPGAVALLTVGDEIVMLESFGSRDLEANAAMANDTIFRIYSMTKPITSLAAMMLYEQGALALDDPVAAYLPELAGLQVGIEALDEDSGEPYLETVPAGRDMTIRDLLRHTSGLTYGFFDESLVDRLNLEAGVLLGAPTLADTVERLASLPLKHQPGTVFEYSVSTDVLAQLVQVVSGQPFDRFLQDRVTGPLRMHDTAFSVPETKRSRFAQYYARGDAGLTPIDQADAYLVHPTYLSGGGGLVSTASDYHRFCRMLLGGGELDGVRLVRPETVELMRNNHLADLPGWDSALPVGKTSMPDTGFGLGFAVRTTAGNNEPAGVLSWSGIASTSFWIDPENEIIGVYMTQVQPFDMSLAARFRALAYEGYSSR